jgi:phosphoenolpyruvate---glycerone phosphotransferase subunit DhaL
VESPDGDVVAGFDLIAWVELVDARLAVQSEWLTELDSAIGDGDHGVNLARGFGALTDRLAQDRPDGPEAVLHLCGTTIVSRVGGAGGVLYGTLFREMARAASPHPRLNPSAFARMLRTGIAGVVARGMAEVGDKTMVDALLPAMNAVAASADSREPFWRGLESAAVAAETGRDATGPLVAKKGRASYLGGRSADHLDPGAASAALLMRALSDSWSATRRPR